MTNAIVKKYPGVSFPSGKKLYRDQMMDDGFLGHFDFKSAYVTKDYTAVSGAVMNNLLESGGQAIAQGTLPLSGGGLVQNADAMYLRLPDEFKMGAGVAGEQHFLFCHWFAFDPAASYAASAALHLSGYTYQTSSANQYSIWVACDTNGDPQSLRFSGSAVRFDTAAHPQVFDGELHQLALEFEALTATTARTTAYIDGVAVGSYTSTYSGELNQPGASYYPQLGLAGGYASTLRGTHYRCWLKDFAATTDDDRTGAEIIAQEWALYQNRFD